MKISLTEKQEMRAIELFVAGHSRSEVVTLLIETDSAITKQSEASGDTAAFRKALSDKLRGCDPTSGRFAFKHARHFEFCVNYRVDNLTLQYDIERADSVDLLRDQLKGLDEDIETLSGKIETRTDTDTYLKLIKARDALRKRRVEAHDKLIERLERLYFASNRFKMKGISDEIQMSLRSQRELEHLLGRGFDAKKTADEK